MPDRLRVLVVECPEHGRLERLSVARDPIEPDGYLLAAVLVYQRLHMIEGCEVVPTARWESSDGYSGQAGPVVGSAWAANRVGRTAS